MSLLSRFHIYLFLLLSVCALTVPALLSTDISAKSISAKRGSDAIGSIVPDHDVRYTGENNLPWWKIDWDRARELYRQGKAGQALVQYELLLQKKGNIDEARWEYASILIQQQRWRQAGQQLDILRAHDRNSHRYQLARAGVFLHAGPIDQAVKVYGELYESCPEGPDALKALRGLIDALGKQGNREAQLPLLELLLLRIPGDFTLVKRTGALALDLGKPEKAKDLLTKALAEHADDAELVKLLARAESALKKNEKAAQYWQQLVALEPDDIQANGWLTEYYLHRGNIGMALVHIERRLKVDPINADLILQAARLHQQQGSPGKALDYLSLYLDLVPADTGVRQEREQIRAGLSAGLIALITEKGGKNINQLWQDVGRMTRDRQGVFLHLADQLKANGKQRELAAVLRLLHRQRPSEQHLDQEIGPLSGQESGRDNLRK